MTSPHDRRIGREFRTFVRAVIGVAGWHLPLTIGVMVLQGVAAGATILLLLPLMQAIGMAPSGGGRVLGAYNALCTAVGLTPSLGLALTCLVLLTGIQSALTAYVSQMTQAMVQHVVLAMRQRLFSAVCFARWSFFARQRASDLLAALVNETERAGEATRSLLRLGSSAITALIYIAPAIMLAPSMTLMMLAAAPVLLLVMSRQRRAAVASGAQVGEATRDLYQSLTESLLNMKSIRSANAESRQIADLADVAARARAAHLRVVRHETRLKTVFDIGSMVLLAVVTFVALRRFQVAPAAFVVVLALFLRLTPQLASVYALGQACLMDLPAVSEIVALQSAYEAEAEAPAARRESVPFEREVRVDNVVFAYDDVPVIRDVSLSIPAGATAAIVGPSGSGKSTLADLVLGLIAPAKGEVRIDGRPLTWERRAGWRDHIGYVPQESLLFHDSVRANLRWAAPSASEAELVAALETAAAGFALALPDGLDTVVGDRGMRLSGGERQRLSLARAVLRKPRLLVLDEATSALDSENEDRIVRAIERLHGQTTILLITHRLSLAGRADVIYVLDQGRVVESGTWASLAAAGGRFAAMCVAQGVPLRHNRDERLETTA